MKIIRFSEKFQPEVVEKVLHHYGLWKEASSRPQPQEQGVAEGERGHEYGYFDRVCLLTVLS